MISNHSDDSRFKTYRCRAAKFTNNHFKNLNYIDCCRQELDGIDCSRNIVPTFCWLLTICKSEESSGCCVWFLGSPGPTSRIAVFQYDKIYIPHMPSVPFYILAVNSAYMVIMFKFSLYLNSKSNNYEICPIRLKLGPVTRLPWYNLIKVQGILSREGGCIML